MKFLMPFRRKQEVQKRPTKIRTELDIACSKMKRNINMSDDHFNAIYIPILKRTTNVLKSGGNEPACKALYNALDNMLRKRRGKILPVGILPEKVQKYREISTLTIVTALCAKVIAHYNVRHSIEVVEFGHQHFYPSLFDHVVEGKTVGIHKGQFAVLGPKAELLFGQWACYDLLARAPHALKWYGMFPDVFCMLMSCVAGMDNTIMGDLVETYVSRALEGNLEVEEDLLQLPAQSLPGKVQPASTGNAKKERVVGELFKHLGNKQQVPLTQETQAVPGVNGSAAISTSVDKESSPVAADDAQSSAMSALMGFLKTNSDAEVSDVDKKESGNNSNLTVSDSGNTGPAFVAQYISMLIGDFRHECLVREADDGELFVVINAASQRDICTSLFRNVSKTERKSVESDFVSTLKGYERDSLPTPRLNYHNSSLSTDKFLVLSYGKIIESHPEFDIDSSGLITDLGL